ncbi:MAG TPA: TAT-variant-translocated molybdopterin oxidoreductase, partial [Anaeromyxobacteraceae bacterium]|nr:TAT-variant-translocated molybdopterin oxidoreductase [Anaeromyxobacteraceae bacterium]
MPSLGRLPIYGQDESPLDRRRWRSLEELDRGAPEPAGEFPEGAAEAPDGLGRRGFLQLLGASAALAGTAACKPPRERVVSYVQRPRQVTPSVPSAYATAASRGGYGVGLVVTSWEGRPTKIEGNPGHPSSLGATTALEQAILLDLYEPRRLSGFRRRGRSLGWGALLSELSELGGRLEKDGGARLRFLGEPTSSPTVADLRRKILARFPAARFDAWAPVGEGAAREGAAAAFGRPLEARLDLAQADVVLSLGADFLGGEGDAIRNARAFASRRAPPAMNRLYVAEAGYTVTGGFADHRIRMRSSEVLGFARAVCAALAGSHGLAALAPLGAPPADPARARIAAAVAKDLARARGRSAVVAGLRQPPAVHALAHALNDALGNAGATVRYGAPQLLDAEDGPAALRRLAAEISAGKVDTLVVTAWNPAYTAPADLELPGLLAGIPNALVLSQREDETTRGAGWVIAASHVLESWGDLRARDGTASIVQPLVSPLHETATEIDLLAAFVEQGDRGAWRHVRDGWQARTGAAGFDRRWEEWLAAGVVAGSAAAPEAATVDPGRVAALVRDVPPPAEGLELDLVPDPRVVDGRFGENAWLQELPDPITKVTWDNAVHLSPATAARLGVASGDVVAVSHGGRAVSGPVLVVPGQADEAVTVALGYGRRAGGPVARGVGFDAGALRRADAPWFEGGVQLRPTGARHALAITQGHFSMEGRTIALDFSLDELERHGEELAEHRGPVASALPAYDYSKVPYRWGMAIDLTRCTGCSACTVACQAENNIPVVGREQVLRGREMHWLRIDRYFSGTADEPQSVSQPLMCQHCEAAPCEYVCPVNATVHSDEGLNEMVYNRCVGTRYCSNNCPYKVRRFNYLDYHGQVAPTLKMAQNPDVTVRARGVMEKCTYCVQRIERARIQVRSGGPDRKMG